MVEEYLDKGRSVLWLAAESVDFMVNENVESAKIQTYLKSSTKQMQKQFDVALKMETQRNDYNRKLEKWANDAEGQLSLFEGEDVRITRRNHDKQIEEIHTIRDESSQFYQDMFSLDKADAYMRLLAVFYNF